MENIDGSNFVDLIFSYFSEYGTESEIAISNIEGDVTNYAKNDSANDSKRTTADAESDNKLAMNNDREFELPNNNKEVFCHNEVPVTLNCDDDFEEINNEYLTNSDFLRIFGKNDSSVTNTVQDNIFSGTDHTQITYRTKPTDCTTPTTDESRTESMISHHRFITTTLQHPYEPRLKYLLRFPQLYQEFMNSSNLEKLKMLVYDVLTEHCVFHIQTSPPILGVDKIYNMQCMTLKGAPDWYVLVSKMKRIKRRIWTLKSKSFGTLPHNMTLLDKKSSYWNFVGTPIESLDEFHQLQKQKYDTLVSQNKTIRFERTARWYYFLNRDCKQFEKVMAYQTHVEIFES